MSVCHQANFRIGLLALGLAGSGIYAGEAWLVDKAPLKVEVRITDAPSTPEAGIVAVIPDGGLLPKPAPEPVVYAADGRLLHSEVLWHNPELGIAVVFQPPASGASASIYFNGVSTRQAVRGKSAFCPGLLLFTRDHLTAPSLELACRIPETLAGGSDCRIGRVPQIGQRENPLGSDDNYLTYYTGWIKRAKAARVWFATISDEGSELRIDGKSVASWPGLHTRRDGAKGQFGGWVDLGAGLHRIEYFHFEKEGDQEMQAAWRIPGETSGELPVMIPASAYVRSGVAVIGSAAFRDRRPVAAVSGHTQAVSYLWLLNEPVNLYRFEADLAATNSSDTVYVWNLGHERRSSARTLDWLIDGDARGSVTLTASNAAGFSRTSVPVYSCGTPARASLGSPFDRQTFRNALLNMCRSVPADKDPCAGWSADLWATLVGVSEPYRGYDVLYEVFSRSPGVRKALAPAERQLLQDILIGGMRVISYTNVPKWLDRFEEQSGNRAAKQHLALERFDFTLYDLQDLAAARAQTVEMQGRALTAADNVLAQIRLGDVERAGGNIEEAARIYSAAQDRSREAGGSRMTMQRALPSNLAPGKPRGDKHRTEEEARTNKPAVSLRVTSQSWKTFAVQEAAFLTTTRNLIQKGCFFEARSVMQKWELEVPLCKLSGDYPVAEAEYYMAARHYLRALAGLRIFRKSVDFSSSLPEAMGMELECLAQLKRKDEARELAREMLKRVPNHPIAERARRILDDGL